MTDRETRFVAVGRLRAGSPQSDTVVVMLADDSFRKLLGFFDLSWSGYRKVRKGVKKRLHRHMQQLGFRHIDDYLSLLQQDPRSRSACEQLLTVPISRFFRDRRLWEILERKLLPELAERYTKRMTIWCAGCAAGEETYSVKIVWTQLNRGQQPLPDLYLLATDLNRKSLNRARAGTFRAASLKEMPEEAIQSHFTALKKGRTYQISPPLQRGIIWMQHHLLAQPPQTLFNIIFLRNNLLTYYGKSLQQAALVSILKQLSRPGLLIIGSRERLPEETGELTRDADTTGVFWKR